MADCLTFDSGITRNTLCNNSFGSLSEVYIARKSDIVSYTYGAEGTISGITMTGSTKFQLFKPNRETSNFDTNIQGSNVAGSIYEHVIVMEFLRNSVANRNAILMLGQYDLVAIVKDRNSNYWLMGIEQGLNLTTGVGTSNKALAEYNRWTVELHGFEVEPEYSVSASIITSDLINGL